MALFAHSQVSTLKPCFWARESSLERVTTQLLEELDKNGLPHTLDGVAELSDRYKAEKEAKRREREAKRNARNTGR